MPRPIRTRLPVFLAILLLLVIAAPVAAGEFRTDDTVTVAEGETIDDDLYAGSGTVTIDGTVNGDVTAAAGTVTVDGEVTGSVNVAGGTVEIAGSVGGGARIAGGTVTIAGSIGRDVVVLGGTVTIAESATVAGDVAAGVGTLTVAGQVGGDLLAGAGNIEVTGNVTGSLDVGVDTLVIGPGAQIGGDVEYTSDKEATIDSSAEIAGETTRRTPQRDPSGPALADNPLFSFLGILIGLLVLGWGMLLVRPRLLIGSGEQVRRNPLLALGAGLATCLGQILLVIALFILAALFGAFAGALAGAFAAPAVIVILLIVILAIVAAVPLIMAVGTLVLRGDASSYLAYAVGAVIFAAVLTVVGLVGSGLDVLVFVLIWILGLGAFALYLWRTRTQPYVPGQPPAAPVVADPPWNPPPAPPPASQP